MKTKRPRLRGLVFKLAMFYMLLSLPSLLLVESTTLMFEYRQLMGRVDDGALVEVADAAARDLARDWSPPSADAVPMLRAWSEALALKLQQPNGGLADESYVLLELTRAPISVAVFDTEGHSIAGYPVANQQRPLPADIRSAAADSPIAEVEFGGFAGATSARMLPAAAGEGTGSVRRVLAPVRDATDRVVGLLFLELRLPLPWSSLLNDVRFDWPIVLGYVLVFGLVASFFLATWVTRRLNRVARAASAWRRGNFGESIDDRSSDELGRLSDLLDRMALDLKTLIHSRAQLATLSERQRLARDLHDTVKQKAFAMNLQLATLRRQLGEHMVGERILQVERLSQQIQHDLGQILDELRAPDAHMPFAERLRLRAQDWAQVGQIDLDLNLAATPDFPPEVDEALVRIVDEALSNVLRHSAATRVVIDLRVDHGELVLEITDDGRGMSPTAIPGMGLVNMRERACSLPGGEFALQSTDTGGVRIRVTARPSP